MSTGGGVGGTSCDVGGADGVSGTGCGVMVGGAVGVGGTGCAEVLQTILAQLCASPFELLLK